MNSLFMRITSRLLMAIMLSLGMPFQFAHAGMIGTGMVDATAQTQSNRERIRTLLDRKDVLKGLQALGVDANTAKARVAALTDEEVQKIAGKLDKMPAGGDILGLMLTVFIVLLFTDFFGLTSVFSFTNRIR